MGGGGGGRGYSNISEQRMLSLFSGFGISNFSFFFSFTSEIMALDYFWENQLF